MFGWVRWVEAGLPFGSAMCVVNCEVQGGVISAGRPDVCSGRMQPLWTVEGGPAVRMTLVGVQPVVSCESAVSVWRLGAERPHEEIGGVVFFQVSVYSMRRAPVAPTLQGDDHRSVNDA